MVIRDPELLVIGETLVDVVQTPDGATAEHVGGSPANVAMGLARLGHPTVLATTLGDDDRGHRCLTHLREHAVTVSNLDAGAHPTSTAIAHLDEGGAADYTFDLHWDLGPVPLGPHIGHVHTGSIAATLTPGDAVVHDALVAARAHATISYDPNARPSIMGGPDEVRSRMEGLIGLSDVVKASSDDIEWLYAGQSLDDVIRRWGELGPRVVVVTRGGDGVTYAVGARDEPRHAPARVDSVIDTVGAGDSFMAGLISGLTDVGLLGDAQARHRLQGAGADDVWSAIDRALTTSAITVTHAGAYAPDRNEIAATLPSPKED